jgi:hypothetical protein
VHNESGGRWQAAEAEKAATGAAGTVDGAAKVVQGAGAGAAEEEEEQEEGLKVEGKDKGKDANADKKGKGKGPSTVDPIVPMQNAEVLDSIERFYGLDPGSAFKFRTQLTARSVDANPKRLSYLSSGALELSRQPWPRVTVRRYPGKPASSRELLPVIFISVVSVANRWSDIARVPKRSSKLKMHLGAERDSLRLVLEAAGSRMRECRGGDDAERH